MTRLSVNINKIATLRNARGGNVPNVCQVALDAVKYGAEGLTVHPRPDERHIRYSDVREIRPLLDVEFNIEGYPTENFLRLVEEVIPNQVTLVPDPPEAITSSFGWDTISNKSKLTEIINRLHAKGIRASIFVNADQRMVSAAKETGTDRIELYTEPYASNYEINRDEAIRPFIIAAEEAKKQGLGINAGHDLSLKNLGFFIQNIPYIDEVSIGHALISDALYYGLETTISLYKRELQPR